MSRAAEQAEGRGDRTSLLERSRVYVPPPGFDPVCASQIELAENGIVPRPHPEREPELYRNWLRLFGPPLTFVDPQIRVADVFFELNPAAGKPQAVAAAGISRVSTSSNWSGAFIVPVNDTMLVLVGGQWTVPTVGLPPPQFQAPAPTQYACSTWVGLDGQRLYLNSSLPQIGTTQTLTVSASGPPQPSASAFFQWWDRETGGQFLELPGLPVQPGDVMIGAVWAASETSVIAYLRNTSTSQMAIVGATAPVVSPPGKLTISGATAEWILERPTILHSTALYPFPDYGTTTFECWAATAASAGPPELWRDLRRARFIRLYDTLHDPTRTTFISMPTRLGDTAVELDYGDFKD